MRRRATSAPLSALGIDDGFAEAGPPIPAALHRRRCSQRECSPTCCVLLASRYDGAPTQGQVPAGARLIAKLVSPPLGEILGEVLRESDNTAIELLTKELGLKEYGSGSTAAGLRAVRADLASRRAPAPGLRQRRRQRALPLRQGHVRAPPRRPAPSRPKWVARRATYPSPGVPARLPTKC